MNHQVYLVGLISSNPSTFEWRKKATKLLGERFTVVNPVLSKFDKDNIKENKGDEESFWANQLKEDKAARLLAPKSHMHVKGSDVIIANLGLTDERPMVGSIFEFAWAWLYRIPVIAVCEEKKRDTVYASHPFIQDTVTHWVETVEDAVDVVKLHFQ